MSFYETYINAVNAIKKHLVLKTTKNSMTYLAQLKSVESNKLSHVHRMDHLACFAPGMLALDGVIEYPELLSSSSYFSFRRT